MRSRGAKSLARKTAARSDWYLDARDVWCYCPIGGRDLGTVLRVSERKWHASMTRTGKQKPMGMFFRSLRAAQLWVEVVCELDR